MTKSDSKLQRDVIEELVRDSIVARAEIGVAARAGVVTISGQVDSYAKKIAAVLAAERVDGVRAVADELSIVVPSWSRRSDMDIAHAVVSALRWDVEVPAGRIKARVDEGWVWLDGEVDSECQRAAAARALRDLKGVTGVSNEIRVKDEGIP
jgi:osmotically-inducible protein OsmY